MRTALVVAMLAVAAPARAQVAAPGHRWPAARRLVDQPVGAWRTLHDGRAVAALWGSRVEVPGASTDPAIAERAARAFLAAHVSELAPGAAAADFRVVANQLDAGVRTVGFAQTWRGLRVVGGQLAIVFERDRLIAVTAHAITDLAPPPAPPRAPDVVLRTRAEAWLLADTGRPAAARAIDAPVVLPLDGETAIAVPVDADRWTVYVAPDGTPLARASKLHDASSTLEYSTGIRYPTDARIDRAATAAAIAVNGAAQTTADDGSFTWTGAAAATVVPGLTGSYVTIHNQLGALATASLSAQSGQPVVWSLATDEAGDAQLSTYAFGNVAKARARLINPSVIPWLDQPLDFYVNEAGMCNAYSTGDDVHFFVSTPGVCENTGRLTDVVYHEFGHSLHNHSVIPGAGAFEIELSEGLADYNAANIVEDSGLGRGFDFTPQPQRDIDPPGIERSWPQDESADPHVTGLIISGALWDLRKALISQFGHDSGVALGEHIFAGVMQRAADIPSSYLAALIADDDDGDLGNGTPHQCAIVRAFGPHGLAGADYQPVEIGAAQIGGLTISIPVVTHADAPCPAPQLQKLTIAWQVGSSPSGVSSFDLAPSGDLWTGTFPTQPDGTVIAYTIEATFDDGTTLVRPDNPADPQYQLLVGTTVPIWCEMFDHDPAWEQDGNLGDEWNVARPTPDAGDPASPHSGTFALGTAVGVDGAYSANEVTSITTPQIDVSAFHRVYLQYWRWLTIEDSSRDQAIIEINNDAVWENASNAAGTLDHIDKEWRQHDLDITPHLGGDGLASVRWTLRSNPTVQLGGWTIDDVCMVGIFKPAVCGDGILDVGEQCDDGNTKSGDGCSASCVDEVEAGGGGCAAGGGSPIVLIALAVCACKRRRRDALIS